MIGKSFELLFPFFIQISDGEFRKFINDGLQLKIYLFRRSVTDYDIGHLLFISDDGNDQTVTTRWDISQPIIAGIIRGRPHFSAREKHIGFGPRLARLSIGDSSLDGGLSV